MDKSCTRILYVDDDSDSCEVMTLWLSKDPERYEVTATSESHRALNLIAENRFDLYIFDYCMPEVTGADLCCFVRTIYPDAPVMIYSGRGAKTDIKNGMAAGADAFLVKPNDFDEFLPTVHRLLNHQE